MKEISKYIEKNANELFVFENPKNIISDYLNQKRLPILMENEEWVYFKIQPGDGRELIYKILAYSLSEILDGQFLYGFIETGLAQAVDEFLKIYGADSFIHEQRKVTFMKLIPSFLGREAIYRDILISLKDEEILIAFLHEFWEDAMARTEIIVLPVPFEELDGELAKLTNADSGFRSKLLSRRGTQMFSQLKSNKLLEKIHLACLLYIASYASEYNILICCKSIHKEHFLEKIRNHCEVIGVKFHLQEA